MPDRGRMSWGDRLAWIIGSGLGSGFSPIAPGTAGSAAAMALPAVALLRGPGIGGVILLAMAAAAGFVVGVWATGRMSTPESPDPGVAVWDEFVGMWIAFLPIAAADFWPPLNFLWLAIRSDSLGLLLPLLAPFLAFRAMDILKPWPCRRLERLPGGWGIMLDDVGAGIWAMVIIVAPSLAAAAIFPAR